ncbi:MAG: 30S ribosomal protein S6 [Deltaproteobacteria bacterium]|jgi:small subunit ribosomal protein S6|nr:30S ribosomal protein S6 [Deltaproteobacteria bacterium]
MYFRRYETFILLSPNLSGDQLAAFKAKVESILAKGEAKIVRFEERGRQKLAYPVNKELFGYYVLWDYKAKAELASELERNLKIDEQVFKFLTIVLDKNFSEEKYQAVLTNMANEAAKKEKEREQAQQQARERAMQDQQSHSAQADKPSGEAADILDDSDDVDQAGAPYGDDYGTDDTDAEDLSDDDENVGNLN